MRDNGREKLGVNISKDKERSMEVRLDTRDERFLHL